jgi:hypothetical protein
VTAAKPGPFCPLVRKLANMSMNDLMALLSVCGAFGLPVIFVPTFLHYRHERWKLRLEHERHLKTLELGGVLPAEGSRESWLSPLRVGLIIGGGVPIGAFLCAMVTSVVAGFHEPIWIATCIVGLGGVISGSKLAGQAFAESKRAPADADFKPMLEEDAYDVVSARG